jgi:hypothetical protein
MDPDPNFYQRFEEILEKSSIFYHFYDLLPTGI